MDDNQQVLVSMSDQCAKMQWHRLGPHMHKKNGKPSAVNGLITSFGLFPELCMPILGRGSVNVQSESNLRTYSFHSSYFNQRLWAV
jgi:hypothetical protein